MVCGDVLRWAESDGQLRHAVRALHDALTPAGTLVLTSSTPRADEIAKALHAGGRLVLREEVTSPTFRVGRYERGVRRRLLPARSPAVVRRQSAVEEEPTQAEADVAAAVEMTPSLALPVLMYHRIADDGHELAARWRTTPAAFEEQLAYLRENGYRSVDVDEWAQAAALDQTLPGRGVVLTFDDGFQDFENAVPLLQQYGFRAELFVVSGHVGATDSWDTGWDRREPLLDWQALIDLPSDVVRIGSHTVGHQPLTVVSAEEVVRELVHSKITLEDKLGRPIPKIAYPYGMVDGAVQRLAGALGYDVGFTTQSAFAWPTRNLLLLPRLEVRGGDPIEVFARMIERPLS